MARKALIRSDVYPYHITARTNNKEAFPIPLSELWELLSFNLFEAQVKREFEIQALVLMPNHFHLIATTPVSDIGKIMQTGLLNLTKEVNASAGRSGRLFGGRYHWTLVDSAEYYGTVLKYVYRNPVRAGLCNQVEDYQFSTYSGLIGNSSLTIPLHFPRAGMETFLPGSEPLSWLKWLNRPFALESYELIRLALRRTRFELTDTAKARMAALEQSRY